MMCSRIGQYRVAFSLFHNQSSMVHNLLVGNEFDLQDSERARKSCFHMTGCAARLVFETEVRNNPEMAYRLLT